MSIFLFHGNFIQLGFGPKSAEEIYEALENNEWYISCCADFKNAKNTVILLPTKLRLSSKNISEPAHVANSVLRYDAISEDFSFIANKNISASDAPTAILTSTLSLSVRQFLKDANSQIDHLVHEMRYRVYPSEEEKIATNEQLQKNILRVTKSIEKVHSLYENIYPEALI